MSSSEEHIRSMRWLYDDEESYHKAIRKIKLAELKEIREKELLKEERRKKRYGIIKSAATLGKQTTTLAEHNAKRVPRKYMIAVIMIAGCLLIGVIIWRITGGSMNQAKDDAGTAIVAAKAPFKAVITPGNDVAPSQIQYDPQKKVLAYPEMIGATSATISQQPFPQQFIEDPAKFEAFLDSIPSRMTYPLKNGSAYMAIDQNGKVQYSVIVTPDALVFIHASSALSQSEWITYFKALK